VKQSLKLVLFFLLCCLIPATLSAQTTVVSGAVLDPSGIPYAFGTLKAQLTLAGTNVTGQPVVTVSSQAQCISAGAGNAPCKIPFQGSAGPVTLDASGNIPGGGMVLQDNSLVTPAGTQWLFTVNETPGIPTPFGNGPQVFSVSMVISGASQSIGATLTAAAPKLTNFAGAGASAITGTCAVTRVLFGTGPQTIACSGNFTWDNVNNILTVMNTAVGGGTQTGVTLKICNSSATYCTELIKRSDGTFAIDNDSLMSPTLGSMNWDTNGNMFLQAGGNGGQLLCYAGTSAAPYGDSSCVLTIFATGIAPHVFAVSGVPGPGTNGAWSFDPSGDLLCGYGNTSGVACLAVQTAAGTPNPTVLPATTGLAGQDWQTDGGTPRQTVTWVTRGVQCGTIAANGACANTLTQAEHCISGIATLAAGTSTITGISPAFTSATSWSIVANDVTTITNPCRGVPASGSTATFTGTGTDNISFVACGG
jgi:hypothetical protein